MTGAAFLLWVAVPARVLTLSTAVETARKNQPQIREQQAATDAAAARVEAARAGLFPQLNGEVEYQRSSLNTSRTYGGSLGGAFGTTGSATDRLAGVNLFSAGLNLSMNVFDFGRTLGQWRSAQAAAESERSTERATLQQVLLNVRLFYFQARAQRALVQVARDTLANQRLHQKQIEGFVQVGTRPPIDLAQARTDVANADVQRIQAENNYLTGRAQLNQAMGVVAPVDFEVAEEAQPPVAGEDGPGEALVQRALAARPELAALSHQEESQKQVVRAAKAGYLPSIGVGAAISESGTALDSLQFNWSAGVTLSWPIFQGLATRAAVREARATLGGLGARADALAQQVRLEVITAQLGVGAARAATAAAGEARRNARERLRLAEGRYATGVGNGIELSDAQTAATQAEAQVIQAEFNLASARARLLAAIGER